tara:strand:+ start:341 stop:487 length:147 start_codon:yes stop_codon:yes gene_type:complete
MVYQEFIRGACGDQEKKQKTPEKKIQRIKDKKKRSLERSKERDKKRYW